MNLKSDKLTTEISVMQLICQLLFDFHLFKSLLLRMPSVYVSTPTDGILLFYCKLRLPSENLFLQFPQHQNRVIVFVKAICQFFNLYL